MSPEDEAWMLAVSNRPAEAYSRLAALDDAENAGVAARLYWLLALHPELDQERSRHHWLAAALERSRLSGPFLELYQRELEANPQVGLAEPYLRLLQIDAAGNNLLWFARQRLAAAGFKRLWPVIDADLQILCERVGELNETTWLSYLVGVMTQVSFDRPPVYERCNNLIDRLRRMEIREAWAFAQIEDILRKARAWRNARDIPALILEVVRDAWAAPSGWWKHSMQRLTEWAADDPVATLHKFDVMARNTPSNNQVFSTFQDLLATCHHWRFNLYPHGLIRGLVREFLLLNGRENYEGMRPELLRLLVREVIDPHDLVQACVADSALGPRALVEHVRTDPTMRLVWLTIHADTV